MKNKPLILTLIAIAIGLNGYVYYQNSQRPAVITTEKAVGTAAIGDDFVLTDQAGIKLDTKTLRDKYLLVFFGFTHCPVICPTTLMTITETLTLLGDDAARIAPLFVTVDPERDTVEQLASYAKNYDSRIRLLTGTLAEIDAVAKAYRVAYSKVPMEGSDNYMVNHSTLVYLMDKEGKYVAHFSYDIAPKELATGIRRNLGK